MQNPALMRLMLELAAANGETDVTEDDLRERFTANAEAAAESSATREPMASSSRPKASTLLSRFDAALAADEPLAGQDEAPALARWLSEARCEVKSHFFHDAVCCLAAAGTVCFNASPSRKWWCMSSG